MAGWFTRQLNATLVAWWWLLALPAMAQTVSVPLSHWIYDWLERWETAGLIEQVYDHSRPYSRIETAGYLVELWHTYRSHPERFSRTDRQYLQYALAEFEEELPDSIRQAVSPSDVYRAWRIKEQLGGWLPDRLYGNHRNFVDFHYLDFDLYADPLFQLTRREFVDSEGRVTEETRRSNGFMFRGGLGPYVAFSFMLTDNNVRRTPKIPKVQVLEESGFPFIQRQDNGSADFDENIATLNIAYKYLWLVFGREFNEWGAGHSGQLILSSNAPVYDQIKLVLRYWRFKFTHITAFTEYIDPASRTLVYASPSINTFWAGNRLELYLGRGVQFGLSESVVYGNRSLELGYLNPLGFFASLEHFYGDRDNTALSLDLAWRVRAGLKFYGEWFIDDLTVSKLGTRWFGNKFGYQVGAFLVDPLGLPGVDGLIEYTRIKPYVYSHSVADYNKYKQYDTLLGHYLGPNSDGWLVRLRWYAGRRWRFQLEGQTYRHGSNPADRNVGGDPDLPFRFGVDNPNASFLDGLRVERDALGLAVRYEWIRRWYLRAELQQVRIGNAGWDTVFRLQTSLNFGFRKEPFRTFEPAIR